MAANGSFLVVWSDKRSGNYDIYGARVAANGSVSEPTGFAVSAKTGDEDSPTVTKGKGSVWGVSYERSNNIFYRSVSPK